MKAILACKSSLIIFVLLICFASCSLVWAQSVSQIAGTVKDPSGGAVPGAEVKVTQTETGLTRTVVSGSDGSYTITNLPVGLYQLQVSMQGFSTYVQSGIVLRVDSNPVINPVLKVGSITEQVTVQADAAMVEIHSTGVGDLVDHERVLELPLNGRLPTDLIMLSGTATVGNVGNANSTKNYATEASISIAGGNITGITFTMDGGTHNDPFNNLNLPMPFPDSLQEFKVETSALSAQYGHHATAAVNGVTKSGTNEFHGDLFEFVRNYDFNARNFFATARDSLKRNQFGGTLGGPIKKDKLFFFGGYQQTIVRTAPATSISYVPTQAMLSGDFTAFASPACNSGRQITLKAPFVSNQISPTLLNASAVKLASLLPSTQDQCGKVQYGVSGNYHEYQGLGKVDYIQSANHTLSARYFVANYVAPPPYNGTNVLITGTAGVNDMVQSFVFGDTYLIGSKTVSAFHGTVNRSAVTRGTQPFFSPSDLGVQTYSPLQGYTYLSVTGGFSLGGTFAAPGRFPSTTYQVAEDMSLMRGKHQIGFGVDWIHAGQNSVSNQRAQGVFSFGTTFTGLGLSDFLLGDLSSFQQSNPFIYKERNNYIGLYVQDAWKLNSGLTVNAGIRWDPFFPAYTNEHHSEHFELSWFQQGVRSTQYVNAPAGVLFPGDPGMPDRTPIFNHLSDFAPRLGIVWDPRGDGRQVIRAAYGIFYDLPQLFYDQLFANSPPWGENVSITSPAGGFTNPWLGYPGGNPFPVVPSQNVPFPTLGQYLTLPLHTRPTYIQQWNLGIQKQFGTNVMVSASYLGNTTMHLWTGTESNPAVYIPGSCTINGKLTNPCSTTSTTDARRILNQLNPAQGQYYSNLTTLDDGGTGNYNAMVLNVQRRLAGNFTLTTNYTWSHCIADRPQVELDNPSYVNPANRRMDRGNCATSDRHHLFNLSAVVQSPQFSDRWLQKLAGNWRLSPLVRAQSGDHFTVTTGVDLALNGISGQRPNLVNTNVYGNKSFTNYLNAAAFQSPASGTFGNLGTSNILGPGTWRIDMSLVRQFHIREKQALEFRAEAFNVLNHVQPNDPSSALNTGTFGTITTSGDPRIMQFALKYNF